MLKKPRGHNCPSVMSSVCIVLAKTPALSRWEGCGGRTQTRTKQWAGPPGVPQRRLDAFATNFRHGIFCLSQIQSVCGWRVKMVEKWCQEKLGRWHIYSYIFLCLCLWLCNECLAGVALLCSMCISWLKCLELNSWKGHPPPAGAVARIATCGFPTCSRCF